MRWMTRLVAATGVLAAITTPIIMAAPAQAQHRGGGGFHGGGFHGGGFHGGFRGRGFFPGLGIGLGLGALGAYGYYGYPYYGYPAPAYYPPAPVYPSYPYSYPPAYPYQYGPYGAASGGAQYASYNVMPERTVVREVVRQVPYPVYVQHRHHRVVHKKWCNCNTSHWHQPSHWQQPRPAPKPPEQAS